MFFGAMLLLFDLLDIHVGHTFYTEVQILAKVYRSSSRLLEMLPIHWVLCHILQVSTCI